MRSVKRLNVFTWTYLSAFILILAVSATAQAGSAANPIGQTIIPSNACAADLLDKTMSCTSNDIIIADARLVSEQAPIPESCVLGETVDVEFEVDLQMNANSPRYDPLFWLALSGANIQVPAVDPVNNPNLCWVSSLPDIDESPFLVDFESALDYGQGVAAKPGDVDALDSCPDVDNDGSDPLITQRMSTTQAATLPCIDPDGDGQLNFQAMITWTTGPGNIAQCGSDDAVLDPDEFANQTSKCSTAFGNAILIEISNPPRLTLAKTVTNDNGGTAAITDWTLNAAGPTPISGVSGSVAVTDVVVDEGDYTLSESGGPAGYTPGTWSCTAGTLVGSVLTLVDEDVAVCTINNDDDAATLTLAKTVTNDNGGTAAITDWTLNAAGPTPISGVSGAAAVTAAPVNAGVYTLSESGGPAGYTAGTWGCDSGTLVGAELTLALGETAVCTINNNDDAATLTLVKTVTNNNGGSAVVTDWTLNAAGPTPISGVTGAAAVTAAPVSAGVYTLSESGGPAGYNAGPWQCSAGTLVGAELTLANGVTATCTINNDDIGGGLSIFKAVTNDDGGTLTPADFVLHLTGGAYDGTEEFASGATPVVDTGTPYTLSETPDPDYLETGVVCIDNLTTLAVPHPVTLDPEQDVTCTISNDDRAATLTLVKTVTNDNGGTAAITDWTLNAGGPTPISGVSGAAAVTAAPVSAGVYTLSESGGPAGYTEGTWGCDAGTLVGAELTLALNETAVCTINNDDDAATLTLVKTVTNDDGGTAVITDWTLDAAGPTPISGVSGAAAVTAAPVSAGVYTLSESGGPAGYTAGTWGCDAGTLVGAELTLALDETAVCTINNNDDAATLTLVKTVTNDDGGTAVDTDWTLFASGPTVITGVTGAASVTAAPVSAGVYTLSESVGPAGYTAGAWGCDAGALVGNQLTLANGETATCTINNDDMPTDAPVPTVPVPVNKPVALILLTLMMLATGWYFRPAGRRRF